MIAAPTPDGGPKLLTVAQTCQRLAIGRRKLWSLTTCGAIPSVRIGRAVRYRLDELAAWLDAGAPSEPGSAERVRAVLRKGGR